MFLIYGASHFGIIVANPLQHWREGEIRRRISVAAGRAPRSSVSGPEFWRAGAMVSIRAISDIFSDVLSWKPEIVVFSFVWHDLLRTMSVYSFLSFSGWDLPLSKPRLLLTPGGLRAINVPTQSPEEMFTKTRVSDLPFLEHTLGYYPLDWKETISYFPHIIRFIVPRLIHQLTPNHQIKMQRMRQSSVLRRSYAHSSRRRRRVERLQSSCISRVGRV